MAPAYKTILLEPKDSIVILTLQRPEVLNALSLQLMMELSDALTRIAQDPDVRGVVLTGQGRGFCSGADVSGFGDQGKSSEDKLLPRHDMGALWNPIVTQLHELPKPLVCAVNGVAAGAGCGLAVSGDVTVMERQASFNMTFVPKLGFVPDLGTTWHFPRRMGRGAALPHALLGEPISAEKALQMGLVYEVADGPAATLQRATEIAQILASGSIPAILATREAFDAALRNSFAEQVSLERREQSRMFNSEESARVGKAHRERHGNKQPPSRL
eukprot:TRINITY_DN93261_c0_g1_i1.p1 TRINITY_DN93261_c0_g1~~TRINITY_DN93261_c0_g1_i1.p1  ORF type:complete len:272 (-),score=49.87 TRINITY_DN93261_c0_g1_i1:72-887(-)